MAEQTIIERLLATMTPEEQAIVKAKLVADPKLAVDDRRMGDLFGIYMGVEEPATTTTTTVTEPTTTTTPAATHTPALPSAAATTATSQPVTTTTASFTDSTAILAALNGLKSSIDERFKNVITKDEVNKLGGELLNNAVTLALKQADEISMIRETNRREFGAELDRTKFEKFVLDNQDPTTKRNKYSTLTEAYDAMVADERYKSRLAKDVAEQVKQKTSGATVPGQSTSTSMSAAQQVLAKARATNKTDSGSSVEAAVAELKRRERARDEGATVN